MTADSGAIYPVDLLAVAVLNRSCGLSDGFFDLMQKRNFIAAAPLLRLQIDNILRFYATWLVDNPHKLATNVLAGVSMRDVKDRDGKKLTDGYLIEKLSERYPWMKEVYKSTSGFIHLSDKLVLAPFHEVEKDRQATMSIGSSSAHLPESSFIEAVLSFSEATKGVFFWINSWIYTKNNPRSKDGEDLKSK